MARAGSLVAEGRRWLRQGRRRLLQPPGSLLSALTTIRNRQPARRVLSDATACPGETHVLWARNTPSWPTAHILLSLSPRPLSFWLSPARRKALLLCQPFRSGEIGRAQECLKAETMAGLSRCGQQPWWSRLLPAGLTVEPHPFTGACCPYLDSLSDSLNASLLPRWLTHSLLMLLFCPTKQRSVLHSLNSVEVN